MRGRHHRLGGAWLVAAALAPGVAFAQSGGPEIHGFVSEGGYVSTDNEFIGDSEQGSLALFEAGVNVSVEPADRLRAGVQLFSRKVGDFDDPPRIDWAFVDYAWRPWLGVRAGRIKMPYGLYNEFADVDAARLPILLPQSLYPLRNRDVLIAHTGLGIYGTVELGCGRFGELDYEAWLGTLTIPRNALELTGAELAGVSTRYVTGGRLFWRPREELQVGATFARASIDFDVQLDDDVTAALIAAMLAPPDYDGRLHIAQRPVQFGVLSAEYSRGALELAAEYSRSWTRQVSDFPVLVPETHTQPEFFYAMASYQATERLQLGTYYSVQHADVDDRSGRTAVKEMRLAERWHGFQRDAALSLRYDVNDHWLWKLEGHVIDGTAGLTTVDRAASERYWGLFLFKTTVTF